MKSNYFNIAGLFSILFAILVSCDNRETFLEPTVTIEAKASGDTLGIPAGYNFSIQIPNAKQGEEYIVNYKVLSGNTNVSLRINGQNFGRDAVMQQSANIVVTAPKGSYRLRFTIKLKDSNNQAVVDWRFTIINPDIIITWDDAIDNDSLKVGVPHRITLKSLFPTAVNVSVGLGQEFDLTDENGNALTSPFLVNGTSPRIVFLTAKMSANFVNQILPFAHKSMLAKPVFSYNDGSKNVEKELSFTLFDNLPPFPADMSGRASFNSGTGLYNYLVTLNARAIDRDAKWNTTAQNNNIFARFISYQDVSSTCTPSATTFNISTLSTAASLPANTQGCQGPNANVFRLVAVAQDLAVGVEKDLSVGSNASGCTCCTVGSPTAVPQGNFGGTTVTFVRIRPLIRHTDAQGATTDQYVNIEFTR